MAIYRLTDEERDALLDLALTRTAALAAVKNNRDEFLKWCRITGELYAPSAAKQISGSMPAPGAEIEVRPLGNHDLDIGTFDPRAFDPHCVHGIRFADQCPACDANTADQLKRLRGVSRLHTVERSGSPEIIRHESTCPVSREDFVIDLTKDQCTCDFGGRLAAFLGSAS